jgi:DNA-binding HxlR family transcriptional regulator
VQGKPVSADTRRSGCPINACLEIFGDRWSLLIVRDLMFNGLDRYAGFAASAERIASNILADRLQRLEGEGIITRAPDPQDARVVRYALTEKGIALAPVLVDMVLWISQYEETDAPPPVLAAMRADRGGFIAGIQKRLRSPAQPGRRKLR